MTSVLAVSVDGLAPEAITQLGSSLAPNFAKLIGQGASTLNARSEFEQTITVPNHAGMMTGRRVDASAGGHGYTRDDDDGSIISGAGTAPVGSVFDSVEAGGGSSALFASKEKFALYDRTWPVIDEYVYDDDNAELVSRMLGDLLVHRRAFTFLHLSAPDKAGHEYGWMSPQYLRAVADVDVLLGEIVEAVDDSKYLSKHLVLVVTSDHGGRGHGHTPPALPVDYTIPFLVYGPGVSAGADLYDLNPARLDPGTSRPRPTGPQPVRNADVANLVTELLGLPPVPGSQFGVSDPLIVSTTGGPK